MGGIAIGLSFFATYSSTNSFVGIAGQPYSYGLPWLLLTPSLVLFSVIAWLWIAPKLRRFTASLNSITIPDFIGFRFGSDAARVLAALILLAASPFYTTAVFKGIGNLLEAFLDVPYSLAILLVLAITMVYTVVGGFISVVKTDVVLGVVMVFAALLLFGGTVRAAGGISSLMAVREQPHGAELFSWSAAMPFSLLLGIIIAGTMKFMVEPRQLSRFYALADQRAARQGMWVSTLAFLLVYSLLLPIGIYARNILPAGISDTDRIIPRLLSEGTVFHPALGAFLLLAMIAAAMSSLDSVLLVMASTCQRDLAGFWRPPGSEKAALRATRIYVALFAFTTALIALTPPSPPRRDHHAHGIFRQPVRCLLFPGNRLWTSLAQRKRPRSDHLFPGRDQHPSVVGTVPLRYRRAPGLPGTGSIHRRLRSRSPPFPSSRSSRSSEAFRGP